MRHLGHSLSLSLAAAVLAVGAARADDTSFLFLGDPELGLPEGVTEPADPAGGFELYGHLSFGILDYDDGVESRSYLVNNSNSTSRIGFNFDIPQPDGGNLRLNFETSFGLVSSAGVNVVDGTGDAFDFDRTSLLRFEAIYRTAGLGTVSVGQGSMASDGAAGSDFSGTALVANSSISDLAGGQFFREASGAVSGVTIASASSNFNGGRRFRLRYDTPSFSGFEVAVAYGQEILRDGVDDDFYDIALGYSGEAGAFRTLGSLGYRWAGDDGFVLGSFAVLHTPTGLNAAVAAGQQQDGASYGYVKLGIAQDWFTIGSTALSVDFYSASDFVSEGSRTDSWSVAVVQTVEAANTEVFAVYRNHAFDETGRNYRDGRAIFVGGRWRF